MKDGSREAGERGRQFYMRRWKRGKQRAPGGAAQNRSPSRGNCASSGRGRIRHSPDKVLTQHCVCAQGAAQGGVTLSSARTSPRGAVSGNIAMPSVDVLHWPAQPARRGCGAASLRQDGPRAKPPEPRALVEPRLRINAPETSAVHCRHQRPSATCGAGAVFRPPSDRVGLTSARRLCFRRRRLLATRLCTSLSRCCSAPRSAASRCCGSVRSRAPTPAAEHALKRSERRRSRENRSLWLSSPKGQRTPRWPKPRPSSWPAAALFNSRLTRSAQHRLPAATVLAMEWHQ